MKKASVIGGKMHQVITDTKLHPPGFRLLRTLRGHQGVIHRIAWGRDLRTIATPSRDGSVRVWDFTTGETLVVLDGQKSWMNSVAWSPDGAFLASGIERGDILIWRSADWSLDHLLRAHKGRIECLAWSPTGLLASASSDGTVGIWQPTAGEIVRRLDDHHAWVNSVAWSPNGRFLATGAEDPTVKIWDAQDFKLLHTLREHSFWVTDVAWAPDSSILASAADTVIRLWDPIDGRLLHVVTGHESRVKCLTFSWDGKLLASKGEDHAVRVWRCDDWSQVFSLEEPTLVDVNPESNLAFHPSMPVLATLGETDTVVRIWSIDLDRLLGSKTTMPTVFYRNAKVVLVGSSNTGKSCLARALMDLPFAPQESTHGMKVWNLPAETITDGTGRHLQQEVFLWDLAGQTDYQLVHQLFLDQTSLALILFDPTEPEETFPGTQHWAKAVRRAAGNTCPIILIAGRIDRGVLAISEGELQTLLAEHGFNAYVATSAKTNEGIQRLKELIRDGILWDSLPLSHSPELWNELKSFIFKWRNEEDVLTRSSDLKIAFRLAHPRNELSDRAFDAVIAHLQTQGLIWRLSFGDLILLQPELLNSYASAVVLAARSHPQGLGCLVERDVVDAKIDLSAVERIHEGQSERSLLHAVVERFLEREVVLREGEHLVFPSKLNLPKPPTSGEELFDTLYRFSGPAEEVYATLIVRLVNGGAFELHEAWRNGAIFRDALGRTCGVSIEQGTGTKHCLSIYFGEHVSLESKTLFSRFVHDHIHRRAINDSIERERVFRCSHCGEEVRNAKAVASRIRSGKKTITCQFCDEDVLILDSLELKFADLDILQEVRNLEISGNEIRDGEVGFTTANAKRDIEEYDVFLAYNSVDEAVVEVIAVELRRRGINPWFAKWCLPPGSQFQQEIQRIFFSVNSAAVFWGPKGAGPWEKLEIQAAIQMFVKREAPVIPVTLPGLSRDAELPLFLQAFRTVSFQGLDDKVALDELAWGIGAAQLRRRPPTRPQGAPPHQTTA